MGYITSLLSLFGPGAVLCAIFEIFAIIWPCLKLRIAPNAPLTRFLHAERGKPAWAFVAGVGQEPIAREICLVLASRGFNIVLYGTRHDQSSGKAVTRGLAALWARLQNAYPENKYRVVVVDTGAEGNEVDAFVARVGKSLEDVNLTMMVDCVGDEDNANGLVLPQLRAALVALLRRNKPALVINVVGKGKSVPPCSSYNGSGDGIVVVSCPIGDLSASYKGKSSFFRLKPRDLAKAVLSHAAMADADVVVYPHWPQAMLRTTRRTLLGMTMGQVLSAAKG